MPAPTGDIGLPPVTDMSLEFQQLPQRDVQNDSLCSRANADPFFKLICTEPRPQIDSLASLVELVGLANNRAFAMLGSSVALMGSEVSAINPRTIIFPRVGADLQPPEELIIVQFTRGEQFVELVSRDPVIDDLRFYLFRFEQACNYEAAGCDLAAKLTEEVEHDWTAYTVYDDVDLANTTADCTGCHQTELGSKRFLRMQELEAPWSHWFPQRFVSRTDSDRVLTEQFLQVHSVDTQYASIPIATIENAIDEGSGAHLEALIRAEGFADQPNVFHPRIESEATPESPGETWLERFEVAKRGEAIPVPYPLIDASDPAKRDAAIQSYRDVVTRAAPRETLVDLRHIMSADAEVKMGVVPAPDLDGRGVLVQMCARCHDSQVDPALSRSRFNVFALDQMSQQAKQEAIIRMTAPASPHLLMPPAAAGRLPPAALEAAVAELSK